MAREMPEVAKRIGEIVRLEIEAAFMGEPERMGERFADLTVALTTNLALTVASGTLGNPKGIEEMLEGVNNQLMVTATKAAPMAKLMGVAAAMRTKGER